MSNWGNKKLISFYDKTLKKNMTVNFLSEMKETTILKQEMEKVPI